MTYLCSNERANQQEEWSPVWHAEIHEVPKTYISYKDEKETFVKRRVGLASYTKLEFRSRREKVVTPGGFIFDCHKKQPTSGRVSPGFRPVKVKPAYNTSSQTMQLDLIQFRQHLQSSYMHTLSQPLASLRHISPNMNIGEWWVPNPLDLYFARTKLKLNYF